MVFLVRGRSAGVPRMCPHRCDITPLGCQFIARSLGAGGNINIQCAQEDIVCENRMIEIGNFSEFGSPLAQTVALSILKVCDIICYFLTTLVGKAWLAHTIPLKRSPHVISLHVCAFSSPSRHLCRFRNHTHAQETGSRSSRRAA